MTLATVDSYEERKAAYTVALRILSGAAQSTQQLKARLLHRGYAGDTVDETVSSLTRLGYLDDAALAHSITNRQLQKHHGRGRIAQKLRARGLERDEIDDAMAGVDTTVELELAFVVGKKLWQRYAKPDVPMRSVREKVAGNLYRRGYSTKLIGKVLEDLGSANSDG